MTFAESTLALGLEHQLIAAEFVTNNPKMAKFLDKAISKGYASYASNIIFGIIQKKSFGQIATDVATMAASTMIGSTPGTFVGAGIGRTVGTAVGALFGPVGAIAGNYIGGAVGGFVGGVVGGAYASKYIQKGIDTVKSFFASDTSKSGHQGSNDSSFYLNKFIFGGPKDGGSGGSGGSGGNGPFNGPGSGMGSSSSYFNALGGNTSYLANILSGSGSSGDLSTSALLNAINSYNGDSGLGSFGTQLTLEGLLGSYNSYHGGDAINGLSELLGNIGGVATEAG